MKKIVEKKNPDKKDKTNIYLKIFFSMIGIISVIMYFSYENGKFKFTIIPYVIIIIGILFVLIKKFVIDKFLFEKQQ